MGEASKQEIKLFQKLVSSIFYIAIIIRPDIAFTVSQLLKFLTNLSQDYIKAAYYTLSYLYAIRFLSI